MYQFILQQISTTFCNFLLLLRAWLGDDYKLSVVKTNQMCIHFLLRCLLLSATTSRTRFLLLDVWEQYQFLTNRRMVHLFIQRISTSKVKFTKNCRIVYITVQTSFTNKYQVFRYNQLTPLSQPGRRMGRHYRTFFHQVFHCLPFITAVATRREWVGSPRTVCFYCVKCSTGSSWLVKSLWCVFNIRRVPTDRHYALPPVVSPAFSYVKNCIVEHLSSF